MSSQYLAQYLYAKGFNMKLDRRFHIGQRFLVGVAFANYRALDTKRISNVTIGMFLNNDLEPLA